MTESPENSSLVVTTFGRRVEIELDSGERVMARVKGKRLRVVCGDRVRALPIEGEGDYLVSAILPRDNVLSRPDSRGREEVLAANVSMIVAVAAGAPKPDWFITDRYLAAAELAGSEAAIVWNKSDATPATDYAEELDTFAKIGYPVLATSSTSGDGMDALGKMLVGHTAIFAGQSGVGKTSLINRLLGQTRLKTAAISTKSGEGRHTTVNSAMLSLPGGGTVIDSPGVRDFAPAIDSPEKTVVGFREIETSGRDCRYANCRHLREPGCAVKEAVEGGTLSARRYESYRRLLRLTENFASRFS